MTIVPPYLKSEVTSRLLANIPALRQLFNQDTVNLSGEEFETVLVAVWLMGYGDGVNDGADGETGKMSDLLAWALDNMVAA